MQYKGKKKDRRGARNAPQRPESVRVSELVDKYGWTTELITKHLGEPDFAKNGLDEFYLLRKVRRAEKTGEFQHDLQKMAIQNQKKTNKSSPANAKDSCIIDKQLDNQVTTKLLNFLGNGLCVKPIALSDNILAESNCHGDTFSQINNYQFDASYIDTNERLDNVLNKNLACYLYNRCVRAVGKRQDVRYLNLPSKYDGVLYQLLNQRVKPTIKISQEQMIAKLCYEIVDYRAWQLLGKAYPSLLKACNDIINELYDGRSQKIMRDYLKEIKRIQDKTKSN